MINADDDRPTGLQQQPPTFDGADIPSEVVLPAQHRREVPQLVTSDSIDEASAWPGARTGELARSAFLRRYAPIGDVNSLLTNRSIRVTLALVVVVLLNTASRVVPWVEGAFPLGGGLVVRALQYAGLACVVTLLAVVAIGAWIAPAWILARLMSPGASPTGHAIRAIVLAFMIQPLVHTTGVLLGGAAMNQEEYRLLLLILQAILVVGVALLPSPPQQEPTAARAQQPWLHLGTFVFGLVLLLLPAIAWVDFDSDGLELLALGRSISSQFLPTLWTGKFPPTDIGMITASYPVGWLVALGGVGEVAARLPAIGYAVAIAVGVLALAEQKARRVLTNGEVAMMLLGVAAVVLTLAFNAAYSPYSTDMASPTSIDLLVLAFLLAAVYFVFEGATRWTAASVMLLALTRPTALLLLVMLTAGIFAVERDWRSPRWRNALVGVAVSVVVILVHSVATGTTDADAGAMSRVRYLRFDDWTRLRYLIVPAGVIPALSFFSWRRMDATSRALTLLTLAYFAFFYCMASYSLHHFAPAMLLPLVVFWREAARRESVPGTPWRLVVSTGVVAAIALAVPRSFAVYRDNRRLAADLSYEIGDYRGNFEAMSRAFEGRRAVTALFASPFELDPQAARLTDPLALVHYAAASGNPGAATQYVVRDSSATPPAGTVAQATLGGATLYVRDVDRWQRERLAAPGPAPRSRFYNVPRTSLFPHLTVEAGLATLDIRGVLSRLKALTRGT